MGYDSLTMLITQWETIRIHWTNYQKQKTALDSSLPSAIENCDRHRDRDPSKQLIESTLS